MQLNGWFFRYPFHTRRQIVRYLQTGFLFITSSLKPEIGVSMPSVRAGGCVTVVLYSVEAITDSIISFRAVSNCVESNQAFTLVFVLVLLRFEFG